MLWAQLANDARNSDLECEINGTCDDGHSASPVSTAASKSCQARFCIKPFGLVKQSQHVAPRREQTNLASAQGRCARNQALLVLRTALAEVNGLQTDVREHADDDPHGRGDGHEPEHLRHQQAGQHEVADQAQHMAEAGCQDHPLGGADHASAQGR